MKRLLSFLLSLLIAGTVTTAALPAANAQDRVEAISVVSSEEYEEAILIVENHDRREAVNLSKKAKKKKKSKKSVTVYVTRTGECYHTHKCGRGTYHKSTLAAAKERGLRACKKCY